MSVKGMAAAKQYHDENTGMPFDLLKLSDERGKDTAVIRILKNPHEIESIFLHREFNVFKTCRCLGDEMERDADCPLCVVDAPRTLRTYVPVRVRGDSDPNHVQIIEMGRESLKSLEAIVEELPTIQVELDDGDQVQYVEVHDMTGCDLKAKRTGKKLDTKYYFIPVPDTTRPLSAEELALEVPNIDDAMKHKPLAEMERAAQVYERFKNARAMSDGQGSGESEAARNIPF